MHIAVCDDESYFRKILIKDLNTYAEEYCLELIIYEYRDGNDLLTSNISFDVIFMDYRMEERNGLDTVSVLRKRNIDTKVIFISSYKEVVFDSMKVNTFRFLVKPYNKEDLYEALNSVIAIQEANSYIVLKDTVNQKNITIPEDKIIYAQADNNYAEVVTPNGIFVYLDKISKLEKELKDECFYRSNRSFIVNFSC